MKDQVTLLGELLPHNLSVSDCGLSFSFWLPGLGIPILFSHIGRQQALHCVSGMQGCFGEKTLLSAVFLSA